MAEQQFESSVKLIPYSQDLVYAKLSDLTNLSMIKERINDPMVDTAVAGKVPQDKLEQIKERVKDMTFDRDSITTNVPPMGELSLRIIEREEPKCIKFEAVNSPIPANLWIQLLPVTETQCKMKLTVRAELNMFIKAMVSKPLKEGVEKLADMLAMIPYGA